MNLTGAIRATGQVVTLESNTAGQAIDLGSTTDTAVATLELSDAELDNITARVLRIGSDTAGPLTISDDVTFGPAATDTLHLISGGSVESAAYKAFRVPHLAIEAGGWLNVSNSNNTVETVALLSSNGFFTNSVGFTVGEVDGVAGIDGTSVVKALSGDLLISDTSAADDVRGINTFQVILRGEDAKLTVAEGARIARSGISYLADKMDLQGTISTPSSVLLMPYHDDNAIDLGSTTDTAVATLELSDAELDNITAGVLRIGSDTAGPLTIAHRSVRRARIPRT